MEHLENITVEDLQQALDNVEGKKPTQRLLAAIAYKNGVPQTELADWYDVERKTIYNWLERLDAESLEHAVTDAHRSGRKRKLSEDQQREFAQALHEPPSEVGFDAPGWTPALAQQYLEETYDVEYSTASCRRLMKEAGLRYRSSGRTTTESAGGGSEGRNDRGGTWTPR